MKPFFPKGMPLAWFLMDVSETMAGTAIEVLTPFPPLYVAKELRREGGSRC